MRRAQTVAVTEMLHLAHRAALPRVTRDKENAQNMLSHTSSLNIRRVAQVGLTPKMSPKIVHSTRKLLLIRLLLTKQLGTHISQCGRAVGFIKTVCQNEFNLSNITCPRLHYSLESSLGFLLLGSSVPTSPDRLLLSPWGPLAPAPPQSATSSRTSLNPARNCSPGQEHR